MSLTISIWILIPPFPKRTCFMVLTLLMIWKKKISREKNQSGLFQIVRRWKLEKILSIRTTVFLGLYLISQSLGKVTNEKYNHRIYVYDMIQACFLEQTHSFLLQRTWEYHLGSFFDAKILENIQEAKRTIRWYSSKNRKGWWLKTENRNSKSNILYTRIYESRGRMI